MDKALLLVNTGTPDDPGKAAVKRYLSEFLNDPLVIDMPAMLRHILVNRIIIPFRVSHSSSMYQELWTSEGSPLRYIMGRVVTDLRAETGDKYRIIGAMRYGNPGIAEALQSLKGTVNKITILPLYPQFTFSTTGSVKKFITEKIAEWDYKPKVTFIDQFYSDEGFISAFASVIARHNPGEFDHIVFSYHSLPMKHLKKIHSNVEPLGCECENKMPSYGERCYKATCYETSRLLASALRLSQDSFSTSFQSRFFGKWAGPFTDDLLRELLLKGKRKVLIAAPSFTIDCLETIIEIGHQYKDLFRKSGGELVMAESLNDNEEWIRALAALVMKHDNQ
ncbi:MAG TPA: ferrochelatase [Bacteroidales bacterium]|nr:ferrochelatase [Bacteroidales bacterium]